MKTAISIPDDVFERAERLARKQGRSRSELYSTAVREYVARYAEDQVTEALDHVAESVQGQSSAFSQRAARLVLERTEW